MLVLEIDYKACTKCMECVEICVADALSFDGEHFIFRPDECNYCETCIDVCMDEAIKLYEK